MKFLCALMMFSILGAQVQALSCMRPNVARTFNNHQDAPEVYRLMVGRVDIKGATPKYVEGKPRSVKATVTGKFIGRNGLSKTQSLNITLKTQCLAVWCGGIPQDLDHDVIMYIQQTAQGDVIEIGPCPGGFGEVPSDERIALLQRCLRKGKCSDADVKRFEFK